MLKKATLAPLESVPWHNLPTTALETNFFGRARELWELERGLLQGAKRITIAQFVNSSEPKYLKFFQ